MSITPAITLNDIARRLSVSKVTVSKALRDHPDIGAEMKQRVQEVARELGYMPNFNARNLSSKKSRAIGLVVPKIAHHFFSSSVESIYKTAYTHQYDIIMTVSQENPVNEIKHIQTLLSMRVAGLLVSITEKTRDPEIFQTVNKRGVPLVFFDRVLEGLGNSSVVANDREAANELIRHTIGCGYRKIAHSAGYAGTNIGRERKAGFLQAMSESELAIPEDWIIEGGFGESDGYAAMMQISKQSDKPEIIFAVTFPVALGIQAACLELGLSVPGDIDVICFGGSPYNRFVSPSLSYMDQRAEEMGRQALELLLEELDDPESRRGQQIVVPSRLVTREKYQP